MSTAAFTASIGATTYRSRNENEVTVVCCRHLFLHFVPRIASGQFREISILNIAFQNESNALLSLSMVQKPNLGCLCVDYEPLPDKVETAIVIVLLLGRRNALTQKLLFLGGDRQKFASYSSAKACVDSLDVEARLA